MTIYYEQTHALYYIFDEAGELDIPMTRNVQIYGWTLYYTSGHYFITSPSGDVKRYEPGSTYFFTNWYERQTLLDVFVRANGIPSHCCTALLGSASTVPASTTVGLLTPTAPSASASASASAYAYTYAAVSTTALPAAAADAAARRKKPTKPHLVSLVLTAAINEKRLCPITFESITETSTCIAPCYHSFDTDAINSWLESHTTCPECRETCME
jgi:hypothetical protein